MAGTFSGECSTDCILRVIYTSVVLNSVPLSGGSDDRLYVDKEHFHSSKKAAWIRRPFGFRFGQRDHKIEFRLPEACTTERQLPGAFGISNLGKKNRALFG